MVCVVVLTVVAILLCRRQRSSDVRGQEATDPTGTQGNAAAETNLEQEIDKQYETLGVMLIKSLISGVVLFFNLVDTIKLL